MGKSQKILMSADELLSNSEVPITIHDKILLTAGEWNDSKYKGNEIEHAFLNTDWNNRSNFSLYLDHKDTDGEGVANWVGYVKNIRVEDGKSLLGDLEVWNPMVAMYLTKANARFGVSATLRGSEDEKTHEMKDFLFESFSVVTNPACKDAFINLSQKKDKIEILKTVTGFEAERKKRGMSEGEFYAAPRQPASASKLPIFDKSHAQNAMARFSQTQFADDAEKAKAKSKIIASAGKFGIEVSDDFKKLEEDTLNKSTERRLKIINMAEKSSEEQTEQTTVEAPETEAPAEEAPAKASEEVAEEEVSEEVSEPAKAEDTSEDAEEVAEDEKSLSKSLSSMSEKDLKDYSTFVVDFVKKNPTKTLSDAIKAFEHEMTISKELETLSDAELLEQISDRHAILTQRSLNANKETPEQKMANLSQKIQELQNKLKEPARKTLSAAPKLDAQPVAKDPIEAMADFVSGGGEGSFSM